MSDFYQKMFRLTGGVTYTILGSAGTGENAGETLETCVGLVSDIAQNVKLRFAGATGWMTGVSFNAGTIYPYRPVGVRGTTHIRGLA